MTNMNSFYKVLFCCSILALAFGIVRALEVDNDLIHKINEMQSTWRAGVNHVRFPKTFAAYSYQRDLKIPVEPGGGNKMPNSFDARTHFKECSEIIRRVRDQGFCDSSWAVAIASMLSDKTCIQTQGKLKVHLSANELISCCTKCVPKDHSPCSGGNPYEALVYFTNTGLVTGGEVNSYEGCQPYDRRFYDGTVVWNCTKGCTNLHATPKRTKGKSIYRIENEASIQEEIFRNGPVVAEISVYEDFYYYKDGIYNHLHGKQLGVHYLRIIGWGKKNNSTWWITVNSNGEEFGESGTMLFKRGLNVCGIESNVLTIKKVIRDGDGDDSSTPQPVGDLSTPHVGDRSTPQVGDRSTSRVTGESTTTPRDPGLVNQGVVFKSYVFVEMTSFYFFLYRRI